MYYLEYIALLCQPCLCTDSVFSAFHSTIKHLVDAISSLQAAINYWKQIHQDNILWKQSSSVKFQGITCIGYSIPAWKTPAIPKQSLGQQSDCTHPAGRDQHLQLHLSLFGVILLSSLSVVERQSILTNTSIYWPQTSALLISLLLVSVQLTLRQDILSLVSHLLVAPCTPWFHGTAWNHLDLLLLWYLSEQEQWSLQRLSNIPPQTALIISFEIITFHLHLPERKENSRKQINHNLKMLPKHRQNLGSFCAQDKTTADQGVVQAETQKHILSDIWPWRKCSLRRRIENLHRKSISGVECPSPWRCLARSRAGVPPGVGFQAAPNPSWREQLSAVSVHCLNPPNMLCKWCIQWCHTHPPTPTGAAKSLRGSGTHRSDHWGWNTTTLL